MRKNKTLETLSTMGSDAKKYLPELVERSKNDFLKNTRQIRRSIKKLPNSLKLAGKDTGNGYLYGQAMTTIRPYFSEIQEKLDFRGYSSGLAGMFLSAAQDGMMIFGAALYPIVNAGGAKMLAAEFGTTESTVHTGTEIAALYVGAKIVSNTITGLHKWYISARDRVSEE